MKKTVPPKTQAPVHIPNNFVADEILKDVDLKVTAKANLKAALYYILDVLYNLSLNREYQDGFEKEGGYPLNAQLLKKLIGNRYKMAFDLLEDKGVIIRHTGYTTGKQAKLVRLTTKYEGAPVKISELPPGKICKKVIKYRWNWEKKNETTLSGIPYITKWFEPNQLQMDKGQAHVFIEFYRTEMEKRIPEILPEGWSKEEIESRVNLRTNNMLRVMEQYFLGDLRLSKTGNDHRLHSILSATKKELRSLFTYNGETLISIDLKSSQPYLLNYITRQEFYQKESEKNLEEFMPEIKEEWKGIKVRRELTNILLMFPVSYGTLAGKGSHEMSFSKVSWKDDFYSLLVAKAAEEGKNKVFPNRESTKKKMMNILYDTSWYMDKDTGWSLFKKWFPVEASLIEFFRNLSNRKQGRLAQLMKKTNREGKRLKIGKEYDVLNYLPILLQRVESHLMLEVVCKKISEEYPDAPLLTIHDCILTTQEYAKRVETIVIRELTEQTGVVPGVTIEELNGKKALEGLQKLAENDMKEILKRKTEKEITGIYVGKPLLYENPRDKDKRGFATRYIDPDREPVEYTPDFETDFDEEGNEYIVGKDV
jgi:hypothetical protein